MIKIKLGVEDRYSILKNFNNFHGKSDRMVADLSSVMKITDKVKFTDKDYIKYKIEENVSDEIAFRFDNEKNEYITYEFESDDLICLFKRLYHTIYSVYCIGTLSKIFKSIKDEIAFEDVEEFTFTNFAKLDNLSYILDDVIYLNNDFKKAGEWEKLIYENKIKVSTIKDLIMIKEYITILPDDYDFHDIKIDELDGKIKVIAPDDFEYVCNLPKKVLNDLEVELKEIGLTLFSFQLLNQELNFYIDEYKDVK